MSIADYNTYVNKLASPFQNINYIKTTIPNPAAGRWASLWSQTQDIGLAPTGSGVPPRVATGALCQLSTQTGGVMRLVHGELSCSQVGVYLVCDRLNNSGGLQGVPTGTIITGNIGGAVGGGGNNIFGYLVTFGLPTAPLTRYTSGIGVFVAIETYLTTASAFNTIQMYYTNQAGVQNQISPRTIFGAGGFSAAGCVVIMPLSEGDIGVQQVTGIVLFSGNAAIGNFGVTMFKPLFYMPVLYPGQNLSFDSIQNCMGQMPFIDPNACLYAMFLQGTGVSPQMLANLTFIEE